MMTPMVVRRQVNHALPLKPKATSNNLPVSLVTLGAPSWCLLLVLSDGLLPLTIKSMVKIVRARAHATRETPQILAGLLALKPNKLQTGALLVVSHRPLPLKKEGWREQVIREILDIIADLLSLRLAVLHHARHTPMPSTVTSWM